MKKFGYGLLLGLLVGVGIGWLVFSRAGQRNVEQGMDEVGKQLKDVSK